MRRLRTSMTKHHISHLHQILKDNINRILEKIKLHRIHLDLVRRANLNTPQRRHTRINTFHLLQEHPLDMDLRQAVIGSLGQEGLRHTIRKKAMGQDILEGELMIVRLSFLAI
jgi:hypothetical protein